MDVKEKVVDVFRGISNGKVVGVYVNGEFYPFVGDKLIVPGFPIKEVGQSVYEYVWNGVQVVEEKTGQEFVEIVRKSVEFMEENGLWHLEHTEVGDGILVKSTYKDGMVTVSVSEY